MNTYIVEQRETLLTPESYELANSGGARVSKHVQDGKLKDYLYEDAKTMIEVMERGERLSGNSRCVGFQNSNAEYSWLTYKEFMKRSKHFGSGLINIGLKPGQSSNVGIYAKNCLEWLIAQYGCFYQSALIVGLYDTLKPEACTFMINHAELSVIICDTESKAKAILLRDETPCLRHIILMTDISDEVQRISEMKGVNLHLFKDIEELGRLNQVPSLLPQPSDVAMICFTSGTTGDPKGAMLTHKNIISAVEGVLLQMGNIKLDKYDCMISYLPLAHILEQMVEVCIFLHGGSVGFYRGDISFLIEDMRILRPTFFPAVPRLLNKLFDQAHAQVNEAEKRKAFHSDITAIKKKEKVDTETFDSEVFRPFHNSLGGKIRLIITGAAPIADRVLRFYNTGLNCSVIEVYGQSECAGPCTANVVSTHSSGNVGPPLACVMIKLEDVPELGYYKANNKGEICVKGHSVFKGYFKDDKKTAQAMDEDGWLHTGDIGIWLPNGTLKIVDRKTHIFKLSQGEFVAPERIENVYLRSPYISQILVCGDTHRSFLVAIVIPDKEVIIPWCKENSRSGTWNEICKSLEVKQLIVDDMKRLAKEASLYSFEQVKEIHLHPDELTFEAGQLTPTMKTKRAVCRKTFENEVIALYNRVNQL